MQVEKLGGRIKTLRKRKKLTLEGLAGKGMTKGMLSLIENNKAKPSMESLIYIAGKLGVSVNELLENISITEIRGLLQETEDPFNKKEYEKVVELLSSLPLDSLPLSYEAAAILERYSRASYHAGRGEWEEIYKQAEEMYIALNLHNEAAKFLSFLVKAYMEKRNYYTAFGMLIERKERWENENANLNILGKLELDYNEILLLFAIGKYNDAKKKLESSISLSYKSGTFYQIEGLYRLACFYAMMNAEEQDVEIYLKKLTLFGEFIDSDESRSAVLILKAHYHNKYTRNFTKAEQFIEEYYYINGLDPYYAMEKGKSLFRAKQYEQALKSFLEFKEIPEWIHPFDLSLMYEVYAYIARCYDQLDEKQKAVHYSKYALDGIGTLPETPYKEFVKNTALLINR
ncbi:helix-turn-helix transcriptional regulator [Rossellomorea vietnamensis]|uniref:Helix-turn-helix transcriptional regulator n=1 Tax=Rossellomorea vietnamensis TaxID=218284 RepID=A0A5D4NIV8_9BACI|nr:helix-turn-helix transcriptional regulator [Rossellomorea vietnamensis]